jgi:hypothetical protein
LIEGYNPSPSPFGGYDRTVLNSVSGLPNGMLAQFSNTILDWSSPLSIGFCAASYPSVKLYFTGTPTQYGTFPIYVNYTEESDSYF